MASNNEIHPQIITSINSLLNSLRSCAKVSVHLTQESWKQCHDIYFIDSFTQYGNGLCSHENAVTLLALDTLYQNSNAPRGYDVTTTTMHSSDGGDRGGG